VFGKSSCKPAQPIVTRFAPHGSRWRIRWVDEHGRRKSQVYDDYKQPQLEERKIEVEEVRRGLRSAAPPEKKRRSRANLRNRR
jgi:hypothetical protein